MIDTPLGKITYVLIRKRVKNLNLRLERDGQAVLSVPVRCSIEYADRFITEKASWIIRGQRRQAEAVCPELPPLPSREECFSILKRAVDAAYPLVQPLGIAYPELKLRKMKSQWGNCHWAQGYITLNTALARCPEYLRVYVALHELVHFLHHNHGPEFYRCMDNCMPEWRKRRLELKQYIAALEL